MAESPILSLGISPHKAYSVVETDPFQTSSKRKIYTCCEKFVNIIKYIRLK